MRSKPLAALWGPLLVLALAGCPADETVEPPRSPVPDPQETDQAHPGAVAGEIPSDLLKDVIEDASIQTGVAEDQIDVLAIEERDWPDGTMGCPDAVEQLEDEAVVERGATVGWRVIVDADGEQLDYRVAEHRYFLLCENGVEE
jgi:hypothetical protein